MNTFEWSFLIWLGSVLSVFLGALTGLGGGVVLVPMLVLGFGVDLHRADSVLVDRARRLEHGAVGIEGHPARPAITV